MEILISFIIPFIILLTVVVFIHEYGHYYYAKKYGVGVTDFSIGFGKEIFGFNDKSGTRWKFCAIPLGGYVKFFGDRNVFSYAEQNELLKKYSANEQKKLFLTKPLYQRSIILAAGPFANFILAIVIFAFLNMFVGKDFTPAKIKEVQKDGPAYVAGIKSGDIIVSIDNKKIQSLLEVSQQINASTEDEMKIIVSRGNDEISFALIPNKIETTDAFGNKVNKKIIGIKFSPLEGEIDRQKLGPTKAIFYAIKETWFVIHVSWDFVVNAVQGKADINQLGGPVKIAKISGDVAKLGLVPFLTIMAYISVSIGFINLLPIPLLDGGHLAFNLFEKILGRPLSKRVQDGFFRIGLFLLFSLMFFTTYNDLRNLGLF